MQRVRLNQHALELNRVQQLPQRLGFAAGIGGVGGLGNRDAQALGIEADLGNECRCARVGFSDGATQRLAVTDQRLEPLRYTRLSRHPLAQQGFKASHVELREQQSEGGIRRFLAEIGAQQRVEDLTVTSSKPLDANQRTLVAQNRQDRHQQHPPLRKADAAAHAAIRQRLEKTDQVASSGGFCREGRQGCSAVPANVTVAAASDPGLPGQTSKSLLKNQAQARMA